MSANQIEKRPEVRGQIGVLNRLSGSVKVWLGLMLFLVLVKLVITVFFPYAFADPSQAAFFEWPVLGIFGVLGLVGVLLSQHTGFPDALDPRVSNRQRMLLPILIGLGFGIVSVVADLLTGYTKALVVQRGVGQQYTGFLPILLSFSAASILVEVIYRLFPIPLLMALISNLLLRGRGQSQVFWVLAVLTSLLEPLSQELWAVSLGWGVFAFWFLKAFALNFGQAALFRKYGFLAAILMRAAFYFIWHALYVH